MINLVIAAAISLSLIVILNSLVELLGKKRAQEQGEEDSWLPGPADLNRYGWNREAAPIKANLGEQLAQRFGLTPRQLRQSLINGLGGSLVGGIGAYLLWGGWPVMGLAGLGLGFITPAWIVASREGRKYLRFQEDLAKAVEMLQIFATDSPYAIATGIARVAETGPASLQPHFRLIYEDVRFYGLEVALRSAQERLADPNFDTFVLALIAAERQGGGVKEMLEKLVKSVRDDLRINAEVAAAQIKAVWSARISALMPVLLVTFFRFTDESFTRTFDTTAGQVLLFVGLSLCAIGYVVMRMMARMPKEKRSFR